jgi:hypothetical protein
MIKNPFDFQTDKLLDVLRDFSITRSDFHRNGYIYADNRTMCIGHDRRFA